MPALSLSGRRLQPGIDNDPRRSGAQGGDQEDGQHRLQGPERFGSEWPAPGRSDVLAPGSYIFFHEYPVPGDQRSPGVFCYAQTQCSKLMAQRVPQQGFPKEPLSSLHSPFNAVMPLFTNSIVSPPFIKRSAGFKTRQFLPVSFVPVFSAASAPSNRTSHHWGP